MEGLCILGYVVARPAHSCRKSNVIVPITVCALEERCMLENVVSQMPT